MAQRRRQLDPARPVLLGRRLGQEQPRFQVGEPCRHDQVVGGDLEPQPPLRRDEREILIGQGQDRDAGEIDLLVARQRQQQIDRPLIAVEVQDQCRPVRLTRARIGRPAHHRPCPVICSTNSISACAGTPISQPSTLKPKTLSAPA